MQNPFDPWQTQDRIETTVYSKNGEHSCGESLHSGSENGELSCWENLYGDNLNPHNNNKLCSTHQNPQETQHLCLSEYCYGFVGAEHQPSKMDQSLTRRHIKSSHIWQSFEHTCSCDNNQHADTSCVPSKYVWTGQDFCSVKETPKCGPRLVTVDWGGQIDACSLKLIGELTIEVFPFSWSKLTTMESHMTSSSEDYGEDSHKEIFPPQDYGEHHLKEHFPASRLYVDNFAITAENHTEIIHVHVSKFKDQ